jgi:hypothetical protein
MPYTNIPRVTGTYLDGAFRIPRASDQDEVLIVAPATGGRSNEKYAVTNIATAEVEFGRTTSMMRAAHELVKQGANNISVIRSGGQQGVIVFADSTSGSLTITPEDRDDTVLDSYALIVENDGSENRYLVYDITNESWIFDSDEVLVADEGIIEITDSSFQICDTASATGGNDRSDLTSLTSLTDVATTEFSTTLSSITRTAGTDGTTPSLVERYAAYDVTYHYLDFRDGQYILPVDCYVDDENVADDLVAATYGYFWKGLPSAGGTCDKLGYLWRYIYKGKLYVYFTDTADYFSVSRVAASATVATDLVITALKAGKGGNACSVSASASGTAYTTVTVLPNTNCGLTITVSYGTGATTADVASAINAELLSEGYSTLLSAAGDVTVMVAVSATSLTGGLGGHVLTHEDLTGDTIPAAVSTKFAAGADAELRECNFAHQLASFCYLASTTWSAIQGAISFKGPSALSRSAVSDWVGTLPTYSDTGVYEYVDAPADNGSGILGNKFLAGFSKTSDGYRNHLVTDGNSTDSYAYGGLILTEGASLPNGSSWPYGINSDDEATDSGGKPIDIGKHIYVSYDWPIQTNGYNSGSTYRGDMAAMFVGILIGLDDNVDPIGQHGVARGVQSPPRIHSTQLDSLAKIRIIGLRREQDVGWVVVTGRTAAHPDSDYTRSSTMRCVNRHLTGIRRIARPYIGKDFSSQRLISLQAAIDGYLQQQKAEGYNQGALARMEYTQQDKIMGRLTIKLRMVPPFSIEVIDVQTSLTADETEL